MGNLRISARYLDNPPSTDGAGKVAMLIIFSTPVADGVVGCIDQIKKTVEIDD
jgi:hypothetical protein